MTIIQFQYILAVNKYKNFTIAAQKCFVTQPTLSMQIQKLEENLGVLIFDRNKKPLQTTEIGEKIISQAQKIVNDSQRIYDIINQYKGFVGGDFRLAVIPTISSTLIPIFLSSFIEKNPKVMLKIEEKTTQEAILGILDGYFDAAIVATPLNEDLIEEKIIFEEPFVAYIPEKHRLSSKEKIKASDLDLRDILMIEDGHCFRQSVLNICKNKLKEDDDFFEIKSGNFETLIKLANKGMGMTLLPYLHGKDLSAENKKNIRSFSDPVPGREISLVYHKNKLKSGVLEALFKHISEEISKEIPKSKIKVVNPFPK